MLEENTSSKRNCRFPTQARLLTSADYSHVFDQAGIKVGRAQALVLARSSNQKEARLGLVVAKKNIKKAHQRNRFKRLARETFRQRRHTLPPIDAIVLARRGADALSNQELIKLFNGLWVSVANKACKQKRIHSMAAEQESTT